MLNPQINRRPVSRIRRAALVAVLLAAALPIAAATQPPSTASGTIVDPSGLPLPDAPVRLMPIGGETVFEARTDRTGSFHLSDIPPGEYMLSVSYMGFSGVRQRMRIAGAVTIKLQLEVGTLSETVTVGRAPVPSSTSAVPASYLNPPACGSTEVGGNIKPPRKVRDVRPRYKQAWLDNNTRGSVLVQARIGVDGRIREVGVVSPTNPELEDEALWAVSQWEFTPTWLNCQAVEVRMFVTVSFDPER